MPSNSSLKKAIKISEEGRAMDARIHEQKIAELKKKCADLEEKLKEKDDYIPHKVAVAMVKSGYEQGNANISFLRDIEKTVEKKEKRKKKKKKFIKSLTEGFEKRWMPISYTDSPYDKENKKNHHSLERAGVKIRMKKSGWGYVKYVHVKFNPLEKQLKKLEPTKITFYNDAIVHIKLSRYHKQKMKEKEEEIERLRKICKINQYHHRSIKNICYKMSRTYQLSKCKTGSLVELFEDLMIHVNNI